MTKINKISFLMFCSVFSAFSNAESIMVSGTLETSLPDVKFSTSSQVNTAFVKESTVTAIPVSEDARCPLILMSKVRLVA